MTSKRATRIHDKLTDDERAALLTWTVYRKRIRRVPDDTAVAATDAFKAAMVRSGRVILRTGKRVEIMDAVCDLLWDGLSDDKRQEWLRSI